MVGVQRRSAGSVSGHRGVIMWPFLSCKLQSYLGTEWRRMAATAWLIGSLKFNYPRPDVLPRRCICGREERLQTPHVAHPARTQRVLGGPASAPACPHQPVLCCASLCPHPLDGRTHVGRRGEELCRGKPPPALWMEAIPPFLTSSQTSPDREILRPPRRGQHIAPERWPCCWPTLLCPQGAPPCIKGRILSLKKSLHPVHSLEPRQSDLI